MIAKLSKWLSGKEYHLQKQEILETWVPSRGWEDPLKKRMASQSSILAWKIPWTKEAGRLHPWGHRVGHDWATKQTHTYTQNSKSKSSTFIQKWSINITFHFFYSLCFVSQWIITTVCLGLMVSSNSDL